ncbi:MAG: monofunctional biosynthetic peptidoglycan transglycosylase [Rhizobacter sp.]|nr:monofunctional biosynthetic peptidoglycan transglycosylase [Rhizobacter sp.]
MKGIAASVARLLALVIVSALALQLFFLARIALMTVVDPQSTSFQRSEVFRILRDQHRFAFDHEWTSYARLPASLKRAVIASEDAGFVDHGGIEWDAIQKARDRNSKAEARADQLNQRLLRRGGETAAARAMPKIVGGSTISQQLAKNLFLSGERSLPRKAQEFVITYMLEAVLGKRRILEIYLNSVEWGEGVFGAEAASQRYFRIPVERLSAAQAARLAVMLPAPKRFEKQPASPYLLGRASTVAARMSAVEVP